MTNDLDTPLRDEQRTSAGAEPVGPLVGHRQARRSRSGEARRENWPGEGDLTPVPGHPRPPPGIRPAALTPSTTPHRAGSLSGPPGFGIPLAGVASQVSAAKRNLVGAATPPDFPAGGAETGPDVSQHRTAPSQGMSLRDLHPGRALTWLGRRPLHSRAEVVDPFGYDARYAAALQPAIEFLYERYFRVRLLGAEHLPEQGRALLVSNHSGTLPLDALMIMEAVRRTVPPRRLRPLVEDFVFHAPVLGPAIRRMGGVRAHFENGERLLGAGQLVAVFPEGIQGVSKPFGERYRLKRFGRGGFVRLAMGSRAPIVPVAVVGAEEAYPLLARLRRVARPLGLPFFPVTPTFPWLGPLGAMPLPTKWILRVGPPIDVRSQYPEGEGDDRVLVARIAEQVRATIQKMVDETLRSRRSVFWG